LNLFFSTRLSALVAFASLAKKLIMLVSNIFEYKVALSKMSILLITEVVRMYYDYFIGKGGLITKI
jgi:hypothetical protein